MFNILPSIDDKFNTVIQNNTFYFSNSSFEESYEAHINSIRELLLVLKNEIDINGLTKELLERFIRDRENGLLAILALTGISNETLKRLTTIIRVVDDPELSTLVYKDKWCDDINGSDINEWSDSRIEKMVKTNHFFRKGLINLLLEGSTIPFLTKNFPLFELKKLSISKLKFELPSLIDTIIRYKNKGSYSGNKLNNPERVIERVLETLNIPYTSGELDQLVENALNTKRRLDFIIPNRENPLVFIESSYLITTSSGQGDKSKTEIAVAKLLKEHYPRAHFIGFVDGVGWYVRKGDLRRMVAAYEDVFTFHTDELIRFENMLIKIIN